VEHWAEVNLDVPGEDQDRVLLDYLWPFAKRLDREGALVTFHYFREPEIRFRVRLRTRRRRDEEVKALAALARRLGGEGLLREWHFGDHGRKGRAYVGEEDRYGKHGWKVAQQYFRRGSETALALISLKRGGRLESPLWGRGLGNPWEGGKGNPWREKVDDPLAFHWSRYVHLFSNQLGFGMEKEAGLAEKQARNYRKVRAKFGMEW
jgi:hypothetical protein